MDLRLQNPGTAEPLVLSAVERAKIVSPAETARLANSRWNIFQIGAGGTGSHLVQHISRLIASNETIAKRVGSYTIVDGDIVEQKNVGRQLFVPQDTGKYKAEVLARRYSSAYGVSLGYVNQMLCAPFVDELIPLGSLNTPTLIIGAVDSARARRLIFEEIEKVQETRKTIWWLDAGNGRETGQIMLGNTARADRLRAGLEEAFIEYLPYPAVLFPDLIDETLDAQAADLSCAEAVAQDDQGPNINAQMGLIIAEMLRVFLLGELRWAVATVNYKNMHIEGWEITDSWLEYVLAAIPGGE